jgi:hypothetical protein
VCDIQNWMKSSSKKEWEWNHSSCSLSWNKDGSWSINDSIFFWICIMLETCVGKLYALICVYVHLKIEVPLRKCSKWMLWKEFWQIDIYTHNNMLNLHKIKWLVIKM